MAGSPALRALLYAVFLSLVAAAHLIVPRDDQLTTSIVDISYPAPHGLEFSQGTTTSQQTPLTLLKPTLIPRSANPYEPTYSGVDGAKIGGAVAIVGIILLGLSVALYSNKIRKQKRRRDVEKTGDESPAVKDPAVQELEAQDNPDMTMTPEFRSELPADTIERAKPDAPEAIRSTTPAELGDEAAVQEMEPQHVVELDDCERLEMGSQRSASPQEMEDNVAAPRIELVLPSEDKDFQTEFLDIKVVE